MATFKAMIKSTDKRTDGTWRVTIRFTHERKVRYIPTDMFAEKRDLTSSGKLKNMLIIERCEDLIREYRHRLADLNTEINEIEIDTIVDYIRHKRDAKGISFTSFFDKWLQLNKDKKGTANYITAFRSLQKFFGRTEIQCKEVTIKALKEFERSLSDRPRAQSVYPVYIKVIFNAAREYYNDEDNDIIRIRQSLNSYRPPRQNVAQKRALSVDDIRRIFALPDDGRKAKQAAYNRHTMALDCFKLSFCLLGINTADLYNATQLEDGVLIYNRTKTRDRRADNAEIHVTIPPIIAELVEKYRDATGERVFDFYHHYGNIKDFNKAVNIGLKSVGEAVGINSLQYYAARHSLATIAANDVRIDKYVINDMLNHTDNSLRITELYIKRDYKAINEANKKVLAYVFKTKKR